MKRLAWFTPTDPSRPGLARYSADLIARLREQFEIDLYVGTRPSPSADDRSRLFDAHDFVWKHLRSPYDLTVYELADSPSFSFVRPYLVRYPGLVVLHDDRLHRSGAHALAEGPQGDQYRLEFEYNHPDANPGIPELGVAGLLGLAGDLWPMRRVVLESALMLLVDNAWRARALQDEMSHDRIAIVEWGVTKPRLRPEARAEIRGRYGIPNDAVVFASFGEASARRRTSHILDSMSALSENSTYFMACGDVAPGYDVRTEALALGMTDRFVGVGQVGTDMFFDYVAAVDVCICLQWPDTFAAVADWLNCLAAGRPTIITDLSDRVDIAALDPRDWHVRNSGRRGSGAADSTAEPACVSIDILDEHHSLRLAIGRLSHDQGLRETIGAGGKRLWERRFRFDRLATDLERMITQALDMRIGEVSGDFPVHLLRDGTNRVKTLLAPFGVSPRDLPGLAPAGDPEVLS